MRLRALERAEDITAMQRLARRLWPLGLHPGGLGWAGAIGQLAGQIVLAEDGELVGWAGVNQPGELLGQVDPSSPAAAQALLGWLIEVADGPELAIEVPDGNEVLRSAVLEAGFVHLPEMGRGLGMRRPVVGRPPALDGGYHIRSVEADETTERVEAHRAAWYPASLPWHPDHRPAVRPGATSTFTPAHYDEVRRTWLYDPAFDLVAEAPDGALAACCIAWYDQATGCTEIEPLGVLPEHRRRGLAGALCMEVAARAATRGGRELFINSGPRHDYPAPAAAYSKVGFEVVKRNSVYRLRAP